MVENRIFVDPQPLGFQDEEGWSGQQQKQRTTIRVWKLGSLEHRILPTIESIRKFAELLKEVGEGKTTDIIWGPDVECLTVSGDCVDKILTPVKLENGDVLYRLHGEPEVASIAVHQN